MPVYRLQNRTFSRLWRRSKRYSDHEIKWLARRRHLEVKERKDQLEVVEPGTEKVVASFVKIDEHPARPIDERLRTYAALKLSAGPAGMPGRR